MRGTWYMMIFLSVLSFTASAQDRDLWSYSCDHFLFGACMRLPSGTSASHVVPADFSLHGVRRDGREILTIYEGDTPERVPSSASPEMELISNGYRLQGFRDTVGSTTRYNVYIKSTRMSDMSVHIAGEVGSESAKDDLARTIGGFRLCRFKVGRTEQALVCPRRAEWGRQLAEWVVSDSRGEFAK